MVINFIYLDKSNKFPRILNITIFLTNLVLSTMSVFLIRLLKLNLKSLNPLTLRIPLKLYEQNNYFTRIACAQERQSQRQHLKGTKCIIESRTEPCIRACNRQTDKVYKGIVQLCSYNLALRIRSRS